MIEVRDIAIRAGDFAIRDLSFRLESGTYGALMGRTGSGKTTVIEAICGLRPVHRGTILLDGLDVTRCSPGKRGIGYVPQDAALFTTMKVGDQIGLALEVRRMKRRERRRRVEALADQLRIGHLLDRKPAGLSGGERQRVALARALIFRPTLLCLDEPLSALDDETHNEICDVLREIHAQSDVTVLHITHNLRDARQLADQVLRLEDDGVRVLHMEEMPCESA